MKEELLISALECSDCYEDYSSKSYFLTTLKDKEPKINRKDSRFMFLEVSGKLLIIHKVSNLSFFSENGFNSDSLDNILNFNNKGHKIKPHISKYDFWFLVSDRSVKVFYINKYAFLLASKILANVDIIKYIENMSERVEDIVRSADLYIERERKKFIDFKLCDALYQSEYIFYIVHIGKDYFIFQNIEEAACLINEYRSYFLRSKIYKVIKDKLLNAVSVNKANLNDIFLKECTENVLNYKNIKVDYLYFYYKVTDRNGSYEVKQLKHNIHCKQKQNSFDPNGFYYLFSDKVLNEKISSNSSESIKSVSIKNELEIYLDKSLEELISKVEYFISTFRFDSENKYVKNNVSNVYENNLLYNTKITVNKSNFTKICDLYVDCNGVLELALKGSHYYENDASGNLTIQEEPTNRFDRNALVVRNKSNQTVGYISKELAKDNVYRNILLKYVKQIKISDKNENAVDITLDPHLILMSFR